MKVDRKDMLLYLVTDRTWLKDKTLPEVVESVLKKTMLHLFSLGKKILTIKEFKELAIEIKRLQINMKFLLL